ncbi:MAG: DUF2971 domain-containing protein [Flavobacterium sp.]|uniref:DUF2971 domain-containing protein n=1 Tax=Flavobacterium sp. TaxID=239 RepID=UPI001B25A6D7|nr:DUF2971 domain-containing protein [Flavobacterium sp.]MBO9584421.1 DUF2971 domain-containing protein [Flavobacterium sp.]
MDKEDYQFNGFTYLKNYAPSDESPIIEHGKSKPENIFKYYSLTKYSVDALMNGYLYASHPIELNDLLDSSPFLFFTSEKLDFVLYEKLYGPVVQSKEELDKIYEDDANRERLCQSYISTMWQVATNLFGIISTSENEFSPLMWPYYTQEKGFQIKFTTEKLEKSIQQKFPKNEQYIGLYPVNYVEKLAPIDISPFKSLLVPLYYSTNIKAQSWNYENEWRLLVSKQNMGVPYSKRGLNIQKDYHIDKKNRYVYYDKEIVEEITLGVDFFNSRDFEIEWLDSQNIKVKTLKSDSNWEYESLNLFMDYVFQNLKDRLFYSGVKYELDENGVHYLVRTKEKMEIEKVEENTFVLTRTNIVKKPAYNSGLA